MKKIKKKYDVFLEEIKHMLTRMRQMSDNLKVRDKVMTFSFLFAYPVAAFRKGAHLSEERPGERYRPSLEGQLDAKVFYPYCLASLTFRISLFSSSRQDVPFTRVLKAGNRN